MRRLRTAYETKDGRVFKTKKEAGKHELIIERSRLATKWFHGYHGDLTRAVKNFEEFLEDFTAFSQMAKRQDPKTYIPSPGVPVESLGKRKYEENEIPF